jgi:hypothetical protein
VAGLTVTLNGSVLYFRRRSNSPLTVFGTLHVCEQMPPQP